SCVCFSLSSATYERISGGSASKVQQERCAQNDEQLPNQRRRRNREANTGSERDISGETHWAFWQQGQYGARPQPGDNAQTPLYQLGPASQCRLAAAFSVHIRSFRLIPEGTRKTEPAVSSPFQQ